MQHRRGRNRLHRRQLGDLKNDDEVKLSDQEEDELESPVSGGRLLAEINGKPSLNDDASNSQD